MVRNSSNTPNLLGVWTSGPKGSVPLRFFLMRRKSCSLLLFADIPTHFVNFRYSEFRNIPSCRWRSSPILAFHRGELGILKRGEKGQECIIGLISSDRGTRWCNPFQCPFLHRKIWPSQRAITAMSIPACSKCIAQVCRTRCGVTRLVRRLGHDTSAARLTACCRM